MDYKNAIAGMFMILPLESICVQANPFGKYSPDLTKLAHRGLTLSLPLAGVKVSPMLNSSKFCIILKFHRTLLCPLITTKIERIPPFEKGGQGGI
jgi:hypothetical protein